MSRLANQVAIVTGGSKGIGAGISKLFAAEGASVVVNYASDRKAADQVVADIQAAGGKAIAVGADVSKAEDVRQLFAQAKDAFGTVDTLVNNAAYFNVGPIEAVTEEDFHGVFNTNIWGMFLTIQEALRQFGPEGGNIINTSSSGISATGPMTSLYMASKGGIVTFTRVLAKELAPRKIRVNCLVPGITLTESVRALNLVETEMGDALLAQVPMGRWGEPEDVAPAALFLASKDAGWITGEVLYASGGMR